MSKLLLSIDFEDFSHDLGRDLGLWITRPLRVAALARAYAAIETFLQAHGGVRATFFCTGIIAEQAPDLIAQIALDGHEIGCHYHFHDCLDEQTDAEIEANLTTALENLRAASGQNVRGFRAPKFRIKQKTIEQYQIVAKHFSYDSSFLTDTQGASNAFQDKLEGALEILPIFSGRVLPAFAPMRLGGTYLKLFPAALTARMITQAQAGGMTPHIYLHPYEFVSDASFTLSRDELAPLGVAKSAYWLGRQRQWHNFGNKNLPKKLSSFVTAMGLAGRLDQQLKVSSAN